MGRAGGLVVTELALDREVLGSILAPFKLFSRKPAVLQLAGCQRSQKMNRGKNNVGYAAFIGIVNVALDQKRHSSENSCLFYP